MLRFLKTQDTQLKYANVLCRIWRRWIRNERNVRSTAASEACSEKDQSQVAIRRECWPNSEM